MMNYKKLIEDSLETFEKLSDIRGHYFEQGTQLEIMNKEGKELVVNSVLNTLREQLEQVQEEARALLLQRETVSVIRRHLPLTEEVITNLDERYNELQIEYQKKYQEVIDLERLVYNFR